MQPGDNEFGTAFEEAMAKQLRKATRLTVSLDEQDYAALNAVAAKSDVSLSWVIRQAIHRFLVEHGEQPQLPLQLPKRQKA